MGINLHSVAAPCVGAVNTNRVVTLQRSLGFTTNADFSRTPLYSTTTMFAQIQGLQSDDIRLLNGLGIQGVRRAVYLWGAWTGLVRGIQKGNDLLIFPDSSEWKIVVVVEDYLHGAGFDQILDPQTGLPMVDPQTGLPMVQMSTKNIGWCKVIVVLQNPVSEG